MRLCWEVVFPLCIFSSYTKLTAKASMFSVVMLRSSHWFSEEQQLAWKYKNLDWNKSKNSWDCEITTETTNRLTQHVNSPSQVPRLTHYKCEVFVCLFSCHCLCLCVSVCVSTFIWQGLRDYWGVWAESGKVPLLPKGNSRMFCASNLI